MREHYGIEVSRSALRRYTAAHAGALLVEQKEALAAGQLPPGGHAQMTGQIDGGTLLLVTTRVAADRRKTRQVT